MTPRPRKQRADLRLLELGRAASRAEAQALVLAGKVSLAGRPVQKPGDTVPSDAVLDVEAPPRFVSRGGDKLEGALTSLPVDVSGRVCLDVGASTGGFTDCLLQRGARRVFAVDVGKHQLHARLRGDPRVDAREGVNARGLEAADFDLPIDLVVVDASFISLAKLLPAVARVISGRPEARVVALVKPQFEVGRAVATKGRGVVRDEADRAAALERVREEARALGFEVLGEVDSALRGPKGNLERFFLLALATSARSSAS